MQGNTVIITENPGIKDEAFVLSKIFKCICPFVGGKEMSKHFILHLIFIFLLLPPFEKHFYIQNDVKVTMMSA